MDKDYSELKKILEDFEITKKDLYIEMLGEKIKFVIITRGGIEKIQAKADIIIENSTPPELQSPLENKYVVLAKAYKLSAPERFITTYGEASPLNLKMERFDRSKNEMVPMVVYPMAMAEKRALSRAVLKLTGLYKYGVFGEDESDEFKEKIVNKNDNDQGTGTQKTLELSSN